jgi:hypothetical protein
MLVLNRALFEIRVTANQGDTELIPDINVERILIQRRRNVFFDSETSSVSMASKRGPEYTYRIKPVSIDWPRMVTSLSLTRVP